MNIKELIEKIGGRGRLETILSWRDKYASPSRISLPLEEVEAMARALLAALETQQSPVWAQARFKGGEWGSCSAEHAAAVMANPDEWEGYECRYLGVIPTASSVPDVRGFDPAEPGAEATVITQYSTPAGWRLVPIVASPSQWAAGYKAFDAAGINKIDSVYRAMVDEAPDYNKLPIR